MWSRRNDLGWRCDYQTNDEERSLDFLFNAIGKVYAEEISVIDAPYSIDYMSTRWDKTLGAERPEKMRIQRDPFGWRIEPSTEEEEMALEYIVIGLEAAHGRGLSDLHEH